jgi:hypothetical protein
MTAQERVALFATFADCAYTAQWTEDELSDLVRGQDLDTVCGIFCSRERARFTRAADALDAYEALKAEDMPRCGTCRWSGFAYAGSDGRQWIAACDNPESACWTGRHDNPWPADHGCPQWRAKEVQP